MDIALFQQAGHNTNWNIDTFKSDSCGKGIIFSPADYSKENLEKVPSDILEKSIFDPQYYLPNSQRKKFSSYPFFPDSITEGFSTVGFQSEAHNSARQCLDFQAQLNFRYLVIPTRFHDQMYSDYFDSLERETVKPFLDELEKTKSINPVYLGIAITTHMIGDKGFRKKLLNWITKFPELTGIYLTVSDDRQPKQIQSADTLSQTLEFLEEAKLADLKLLVGYCNTESLVYSTLGELEVTFGAFENTRRFSIDRYVVNDREQRGPAPRIYLPGLLNWVRLNEAKVIRNKLPDIWSAIYEQTSYGEQALNSVKEPTFVSPTLYKHHFIAFNNQFNRLASCKPEKRKQFMLEEIQKAETLYRQITSARVVIDSHGSGDHLSAWKSVLS